MDLAFKAFKTSFVVYLIQTPQVVTQLFITAMLHWKTEP
ncbi:hypothetical protein RintRC_2520 [Richelia intracellularis]|nr:hypothetical protein RintRC_2520 [Richelia intracellularis]